MPIADPYSAAAPKTKKPPAYPMASGLAPDKLQALLDQGYVDYGDGELIPPMDNQLGKDFQLPGLKSPPPGAASSGGPAGPQTEIRSDIMKDLYRSGRRSGNPTLMNMARPPMPEADPFAFMQPPVEDPLRVMPELPPSPQAPPYAQASVDQMKPGRQAMQSRFPRATSLLSGANNAPPMRRRGR